MIDFDEWYDRFQNLLDLQAVNQERFMTARFSRRELIQMRNLMAECKQIHERLHLNKNNK